jgi:hypothetical protein
VPFTTPPTFVSGDVLTAAQLNILGDDLNYLSGIADGAVLSGFSVRRAASQSISDDTDTDVSHDTEVNDFGAWWSSGSTATTPAGAIPSGYTNIGVIYFAQATFAANSTGFRRLFVYKNGAAISSHRISAVNGDTTSLFVNDFTTTASTDTWKLVVYQNSGGALNLQEARLSVIRIAPAS